MAFLPSILKTPGAMFDADGLAAAEEAVRRYCGWHIAPNTFETWILDGPGTETLFLPSLAVTDVVSVVHDGVYLSTQSLEWSANGYIRLPGGWTDKLRSITVMAMHGYEDAPHVAAIIREVAARAAASPGGLIEARAGAISEKRSMTAPGVAGGIVLMAHEREQLEPYKLRGA